MTRSRLQIRNPLWLLVAVWTLAAAGCHSENPQRQQRLLDIARWQDRRLAPGDSLSQALGDRDAFVRLAAVKAAGQIGRDDARPALEIALADPSQTIRAEAAWSLGLIGDGRAVPSLALAASGALPALRMSALAALAHVPNDGTALLEATRRPAPREAALAWDSLRQQAERVPADSLRTAIIGGLARSESDVRWRVLRCAERAPDSTLTTALAPFAGSKLIQERVHAYRALGRQTGVAAMSAVLNGFHSHKSFRGRDRERAVIAGCRALGALAGPFATRGSEPDAATLDHVADLLIAAASANDAGVVETALAAMEAIVAAAPLPDEAAELESLLPVWRLRLARAAADRMSDSRIAVRAAAAGAWPALRGTGASEGLSRAIASEETPHVLAAQLRAASRIHVDPVPLLADHTTAMPTAASDRPTAGRAGFTLIRAAAIEGLAHVATGRPKATARDLPPHFITDLLMAAAADTDFVVSATAADLLGDFPGDRTFEALLETWDRAAGPGSVDVRRGVLTGLAKITSAQSAAADSSAWKPESALRERAAKLFLAGFGDPDRRIRLQTREAALASGLLAAHLIPTLASLRATLPAAIRDPAQPPVALAFEAPSLRCVTSRGTFRIRLDAEHAPNTCALFVSLATRGWFDDQTFHRVVPDFVVQGGDPDGTGWGGPGFYIRAESSRRPFRRGAVGIADDGRDTGGSQFFVTLSEQPHLNGRYTLFGDVAEGMEVVDRLQLGDTFRFEIVP